MTKLRQLIFLGILLCTLVMLPLLGSCQVEQGVLNLWDTGPITLDPAISGEMTSHTYIMQIFGGLIRLDEDSKPAPDIAESWQRSDDGKTLLI